MRAFRRLTRLLQHRYRRDPLSRARQDVTVLHDLTAALHDAADIEAVQEELLTAITGRLGFRQAVIGVVDEEAAVITGWLGRSRDGQPAGSLLSHPARVPLSPDGGLVAQALQEQRIFRAGKRPCTANDWINRHFGMEDCLILPLLWGTQPVGVLLVDVRDQQDDESRLRSLEAIAQQSASVLGMMATRLRRARERAIREERARIARDIHDTVSQSLFGLVYTLDGCLQLLDSDPASLERELRWALRAAEEVRHELRQTILDTWPEEEVTPETFEADLRHYAADVLQTATLHLLFDVRGDFSTLSARARRSLYRICQEALTNAAHHAAATEASICLDVNGRRARLVVRDNGRGFEPHVVLAQAPAENHFGLRGIQTRTHSLGGTCDIFSRPGAGTSLVVDIPVAA